jgi:SAM-dependent methyltransferase
VSESIVFDRAVEYYDRTRALPPEVQAAVTDYLARELQGRGRVLELGVGTGRMALPLHPRGVDLVGVDLSEPMMRKLIENAAGSMPFPLVQVDGLELPFPDGCLGAAYLCHVLHLIPPWQHAVAELVRVLRPGGLLLVDIGGQPTSVGREVQDAFNRIAALDRPRPGCTDPDELDRELAGHGATARLADPIGFTLHFTIANMLERLSNNQFSSTWSLRDEVRAAAVAQTTAWATERYGDLDARQEERIGVQWRAYDLP